jgi:hypothetical protein
MDVILPDDERGIDECTKTTCHGVDTTRMTNTTNAVVLGEEDITAVDRRLILLFFSRFLVVQAVCSSPGRLPRRVFGIGRKKRRGKLR